MPDNPTQAAPDGEMHPCARCATMQRTCCQRTEILITTGDIARIAAHTGRTDFWSLRRPEDEEYLEHDPDDPNWQRYTVDEQGRRRMLLRKDSGDCTYLGKAGCVLPVEVRPLICRLYPFAFNEQGMTGMDDHYCPTKVLLADKPKATMLTVLGMDPLDGERWRRTLYQELREQHERAHGQAGEPAHDAPAPEVPPRHERVPST